MTRRIPIWPQAKFDRCGTCSNREDEWICDDCTNELGYHLDESLIELDADGQLRLRNALD